ncbi:MAG: hypothetical protein ABFD92_21045 [Planctomycetaceae bacterium]
MMDWKSTAIKVTSGISFLIGVVGLAWLGMEKVSPDAARFWALLSTVLLIAGAPLAFLAGVRYGHAESKGAITGLDMGVSRVQQAAAQAASLGLSNIRTTREIVRETPQSVFVLPPISAARQIGSGQEIVEV